MLVERIREVIKSLTTPPQGVKYITMCFESAKDFAIHGRIEFVKPLSPAAHVDKAMLDVNRIKALYRIKDGYCVVYETDNITYYAPMAMRIPEDAEPLRELKVRDFQYWDCEGYREYDYDSFNVDDDCTARYKEYTLSFTNQVGNDVLTMPVFTKITKMNAKAFLETLLERLGLKALEQIQDGYLAEAGGRSYVVWDDVWRLPFDKEFKMWGIELRIGRSKRGRCTLFWDDPEPTCENKPGYYIELSVKEDVFNAMIELSDSQFAELMEDQKRRNEEERQRELERLKKLREEKEKKRKEFEDEVNRLFSNKDELVSMVLRKASDWADGVAVYKKQEWDEGYYTAYYLVNIKRGRGFYTKKTWRVIDYASSRTSDKEDAYIIAISKLCSTSAIVVTKDKNVLCMNIEEKNEYIFFK
jgi:hypothetical protein